MIGSTVSAVVVAYGSEPTRLQQCLEALASEGARIVLVDNGSATPVEHPLADRLVRRSRNGGFAAGVNDGIRVADTPYIAVINDDAVVQPGSLGTLVEALENAPDSVVAAAPKVLFPGGTHIDSVGVVIRPNGEAFSAGAGQPDLGQFDADRTVLGPCLSAALFRREAFDRIGLLDERYFLYYEDVDWALRCYLSGHETVFVPSATVVHEHAATTRHLGERRRFRLVQRNLLLCTTANLSLRSVARVWAGRLVSAGKAMVKGPDRTSRLQALAGAVVRIPAVWPTRRRNRLRAQVADRSAFAFAEGLTPHVDITDYRPSGSPAAHRDAETRLRRRG